MNFLAGPAVFIVGFSQSTQEMSIRVCTHSQIVIFVNKFYLKTKCFGLILIEVETSNLYLLLRADDQGWKCSLSESQRVRVLLQHDGWDG
jgi:hypothetical protein